MADFDIDEFMSQELTISRLRELRKADLKAVGTKLSLNLNLAGKSKAELFNMISAHAGLSVATAASVDGTDGAIPISSGSNHDEVDLELAKRKIELDLEERKDRLRAAEHEREMERNRLDFEMMRHSETTSQGSQSGERERRSLEAGFSARVKLIPRYDENELDSFFLMFERVAKRMEWPECEWALLIQQVISGKAQSVVSSLSYDQAFDYWTMKDAILQSFELIPEAYRQQFRNLKRELGETCVEFVRRKEIAFDRWIRSLKIASTYDSLREVMLIDEFQRCMSPEVRTYVNDNAVGNARNAAMLADGYELTHRGSRSPPNRRRSPTQPSSGSYWNRNEAPGNEVDKSWPPKSKPSNSYQSSGVRTEGRSCYFCKEEGHIKTQCPRLEQKMLEQENTQPSGFVYTAAACMQHCVMSGNDETMQSHQVRNVEHDEGYDERYKGFVSCGTVKFSVGDEELPVMILRDTGSTQTLLIADESSLNTSKFTGKKVWVQDVNDGFKPVPLYDIELSSGLVSGLVTVGIVTKLPVRGISMLLGNDLAGEKVVPSPVVCDTHVVDSMAEDLEYETPDISPPCVVTRALALEEEKAKENESDSDGHVNLGDTFFKKLNEGHEIGDGHVVPRQAKVQAIVEFPAPSSKRQVLRFLEMCGFYRKFVPNFSDIVAPLTDLLRKGVKFEWSGPCETAFQTLKAVLNSKPVLNAPNFEKPFQLVTDVSDLGVGAVLLQEDDMGHQKPVSYFSKKLNIHQRRYSTIEKECLGLVSAVQHFDVYLSNSSEVTVFTDHNPLTFLKRSRNKNQRLFRWSLFLQPYGLTVVHTKK